MKPSLQMAMLPLATVDDAVLAQRAVAGDRLALTEIFRRYVDSVHQFVARLRGMDSDAVPDIVQQTFIAAFAAIATFRGDTLRPWLFGVALNKSRMYVRSEVRRKRTITAAAAEPPLANESELSARQRLEQVQHHIAALKPIHREPLVLIDMEGLSGNQAAALLGIPAGTLWRRVFEARQQLRVRLAGGDL
ncbi:MAG TPA: RNA polymerase sigma factor [Kofleriaceae bacterium]|nr:RNA polymerase sigma factor [Kofleriaceae bacterium]